MRMPRAAVLSCTAALLAAPALAQANLEPERSVWDGGVADPWVEHDRRLAAVFAAAFAGDVPLRVIVEYAHAPQDATGLVRSGAGIAIFHIALAQPLGAAGQPAMTRCEVPIDAALGDRLIALWKAMILQARFDDTPYQDFGGPTYHFGMREAGTGLSAAITGPPNETRPGKLTWIVAYMAKYCESRDGVYLAGLQQRTADLEKVLQRQAKLPKDGD